MQKRYSQNFGNGMDQFKYIEGDNRNPRNALEREATFGDMTH